MTLYDDEIDLRPYILQLIKKWWMIAIFAAVVGLAAFLYSFLQPRTYESTANILITHSQAVLRVADQFPTINQPTDNGSRLAAYLTLAQDDSIAEQTVQSMGSQLPQDFRDPKSIKGSISLASQGDLIQVTASGSTPTLASQIANTWARVTVQAINLAYKGEQPLSDIQNQKQVAQKDYNDAQAKLESFLQNNQIDLLKKKIDEANIMLTSLMNNRAWQINFYSQRKQDMQSMAAQADALKQQLTAGNASKAGNVGDALAVLNARATALGLYQEPLTSINTYANNTKNQPNDGTNASSFSSTPRQGLTLNLQLLQPGDLVDSSANNAADLDKIIQQAKLEETNADTALASLAKDESLGTNSDLVNQAAANLSSLQAQLENAQSQQRELTSKRDVTWKAYQAIFQKETEIVSSPQTGNEVNIVGTALPSDQPAPRGTVKNTLIGAMAGLALGVFLVLGLTWWKSFSASSQKSNQVPMESPAQN